MSDSTEKDFGDVLVTQLSKLESKAPRSPTQTHTHSQMLTENQTPGHRQGHTRKQTPVDPDTYTDRDTQDSNSPKQSLCTKKWSYLQREILPYPQKYSLISAPPPSPRWVPVQGWDRPGAQEQTPQVLKEFRLL